MAKKIAIVTWYRNGNYGGTLQAFALQHTLRELGYDSEFVDFAPQWSTFSYKIERVLKDLAIFLLKPRLYRARNEIYRFIQTYLDISPSYDNYEVLREMTADRYLAAVCGSDQIWANIGGKVNPFYYLTFVDKDKRIAYAPSIGYNQVPTGAVEKFKECASCYYHSIMSGDRRY